MVGVAHVPAFTRHRGNLSLSLSTKVTVVTHGNTITGTRKFQLLTHHNHKRKEWIKKKFEAIVREKWKGAVKVT